MITKFKIYEGLPNNYPEIDLKVGDIWKGDQNDNRNRWWIVAKLEFVTPNFWTNMNNKISNLYIDLDKPQNKKDVSFNTFDFMTSFTPESYMTFNTRTYDIRKLWNDEPEKIIDIADRLLSSSLESSNLIPEIWFKKLPELEIEFETRKYNI